uniref:Uncharacterized protein n=1 Tax=Rhizophora mucronata TaxID=61149 RepID=A0A2P2PG55_RHIMU
MQKGNEWDGHHNYKNWVAKKTTSSKAESQTAPPMNLWTIELIHRQERQVNLMRNPKA